MPGEQLACLHPAVCTIMTKENNIHVAKGSAGIPARGFKALLGKLSAHLHLDLTGCPLLHEEDEMTFKECKRIIDKCSTSNDIRIYYDKIEDVCYKICRDTYAIDIPEEIIRKIWRIANRLTDEWTYPPKIPKRNSEWIFDIFTKDHGGMDMFKVSDFDHREFLRTISDVCHVLTEDEVSSNVNQIYKLLVLSNIKCAWSFKRTKHKRDIDWSIWTKKWLVLKSDRLEIFNHNAVNRRSYSTQTFEISMNTKLVDLPCYRGSVHSSRFRFKITDDHLTEYELAFDSAAEKKKWMECIHHVTKSMRQNIHPIHGLIGLKGSPVSHGVSTNSDLYYLSLNASQTNLSILEEDQEQNNSQFGNLPARKESKRHSIDERMGIKSLFMDIDCNGDQEITIDEIQSFAEKHEISSGEVRHIFRICDRNGKGKIDIDEFEHFFKRYVLNGKRSGKFFSVFRDSFNRERRIGSAGLKCKEFASHLYNRQHSVRTSNIFHGIEQLQNINRDEITKEDFAEFLLNCKTLNVKCLSEIELFDTLRQKLGSVYNRQEVDELVQYVQNRWKMFLKFRRKGVSGKVVMTCGHGSVEGLIPGNYNLNGLANFRDLPPLIPKHTYVRNVTWESKSDHSCPGHLIFPSSFNKEIRIELATNEFLGFYGCRFAESSEIEISLDRKHWIQDFSYDKDYLKEFVGAVRGGSTLERHGFPHLDCPLDEDSGYFILAKLTEENDMYLTAFKVPLRHSLFVPSDCIHTNDYLKGTWRTMLADEAHIDDVFLEKKTLKGLEKFFFSLL